MKKIVIFALLVKSGCATSLMKFYNNEARKSSRLEQSLHLYQLLNTNNCQVAKDMKKIPALRLINRKFYNLATLLGSSASLVSPLGDSFLLEKFPMSKNASRSEDGGPSSEVNSVFSAKIALAVLDRDRKYKLLISDFSGQEVQEIVSSNAPITSLAWNKSGTSIAYVSYEAGKPIVYIQNIYSAKRYIVANFSGSNSSPAFADNSMLVSLSKDYGTHIYRIDTQNYTPKKIATPIVAADSIDTEADYANNNLIYTSNKNAKPAIYLKASNSSQAQKISIGSNNTTGRISEDGLKVLYVHGRRGSYDLMYFNLLTGITRKIDSGKVLSGSFAPDNTLIVYIKNNQIVMYDLNCSKAISLAGSKYREIFDVKWSK